MNAIDAINCYIELKDAVESFLVTLKYERTAAVL